MTYRRAFADSAALLLARDIMREDPWSIHAAATIGEAARFLATKKIGAAPVINDAGRPLGVVSRSDIVRKVRAFEVERADLSNVKVFDLMTPSLLLVKADARVAQVIEMLLDNNVRRVFVADEDGVLIGVVSTTDIMANLGEAPEPYRNYMPVRLNRPMCCVPSCGTPSSQ